MLVSHKVVPFIRVGGRYVRDHRVVPVEVRSVVKGNSLSKFPAQVGRISHHKWS
jgi:hypothetical protein